MAGWTSADYVIFAVAGFVAITSLVRLMVLRRDALIRDLDEQAKRARENKTNDKNVRARV
jgi:hypothetical protein